MIETGRVRTDSIEVGGEMIDGYDLFHKYIDRGDIIGVSGNLFVTKRGEPTIFVRDIQILTKSLRPLPEKHHGLQDSESRFRNRPVDILTNQEVSSMIRRRSAFFTAMRSFLTGRDFIEVDTPILEVTTG